MPAPSPRRPLARQLEDQPSYGRDPGTVDSPDPSAALIARAESGLERFMESLIDRDDAAR
ncbi:hypothetical protein ABZY81_18165 [Streptomyces sp. NPDC006514]|uniref:hypothetical protein n=1 Tax=Streptomyces sp. NPDC006514 TaxID=3154308 RepID=UPI0033A37B38